MTKAVQIIEPSTPRMSRLDFAPSIASLRSRSSCGEVTPVRPDTAEHRLRRGVDRPRETCWSRDNIPGCVDSPDVEGVAIEVESVVREGAFAQGPVYADPHLRF